VYVLAILQIADHGKWQFVQIPLCNSTYICLSLLMVW